MATPEWQSGSRVRGSRGAFEWPESAHILLPWAEPPFAYDFGAIPCVDCEWVCTVSVDSTVESVGTGGSGVVHFTCALVPLYNMASAGSSFGGKKMSMKGPVVIQDKGGIIEESTRVLSETGVLGKIEGVSLSEQELMDYVSEAIGEEPEEVKLKGNNSFLLTMKTEGSMEKLLRVHLAFKGRNTVYLEPWSPQEDPNKTEFMKKYVWIELPGLRDECLGMLERIVSAVGKLHIRPTKEEFKGKNAKPRIGVRIHDIGNFPDSVLINCSIKGVPRQIRQPVDYPDLPARCRICGSAKHLQKDCVELTPWKAKVLGVKPEGVFLPGFGSLSTKKLMTPATNHQHQLLSQLLFNGKLLA